MKLKKLIYSTALASLFLTTSCEKWLDINHDTSYPETVPSTSLLSGIQVSAGYTLMSWDYLFNAGVYNQYFTQRYGNSQFKKTEKFETEDFRAAYRNFFTGQLVETQSMKDNSDKKSGYYFVADLLQIFVWQNVVDTWGDVPYTEALDANNITPKFDKAEDIYKDLIARINTLIEKYNNGEYADDINKKIDFVYGGSLSDWGKFANSLKLKLMHRLSNTSDYNNAALLDFISNNDFISKNAQISQSIWESKSSKKYPADEYEGGSFFSSNILPSKSLVSYMVSGDDPRLAVYFTKNTSDAYAGKLQGYFEEDEGDKTGAFSAVNLSGMPKNIPLISVCEVYFDMAEIYLRASDDAKAKEYYEKAVAANLSYWGLSDAANITGENGYAKWDNPGLEKGLELISLQRWVSFFMTQHAEAFFERNRTGYPQLSDITDPTELNENFPAGKIINTLAGSVLPRGVLPLSPIYPEAGVAPLNPNCVQKSNMAVKSLHLPRL